MLSRRLPYATDYMTPTQSESLKLTLHPFLPFSSETTFHRQAHRLAKDSAPDVLSPSHHLAYFPNVQATNLLLPDGTDSWYSPGPPFMRRMWAGGNIAFFQDIPLNGQPFHCIEEIDQVGSLGVEEEEKVYIKVKRIVRAGRYPGELARRPSEELKDGLSKKLYLIEGRILAFRRDDNPNVNNAVPRYQTEPKRDPHFSHTIVPTRELLFRFSALTYNAHAIHLDRAYCREIEGHRDLLVQGPLTVMLMIEVLRTHLRNCADNGSLSSWQGPEETEPQKILAVQYRYWRPLYVDEPMKICVRRIRASDSEGITLWGIWIEGPDGGFAVKGTAKTTGLSSIDFQPAREGSNDHQEEGHLEEDGESIPMEHVAFQRETIGEFED